MKRAALVFFAAAGIFLSYYYINVYAPEKERETEITGAFERQEAVNYLLNEMLLSGRLMTGVKGNKYTARLPLRYSPESAVKVLENYVKARRGVTVRARDLSGDEKEGVEVLFFLKVFH